MSGKITKAGFWRTTPKPEDGQLCFIVINGKPLPDVLVFRPKLDSFFVHGWRIKFDEVEAWGAFGDIPAYRPAISADYAELAKS